jgi:nicotinate-nucleotide--dimethylbenzimidazole phosphoribosyltransferase
LSNGVATASVMARALDVRLEVVDVGVGEPTANILDEPGLSVDRFVACWETGRATVRDLAPDLLVLGEMGIGNTTSAAAVCHALFGLMPEDWTGRGTGIDDIGLTHKIDVVAGAVARMPGGLSPLEILRHLGGAELVAIAGATLEARMLSIPVIIDGFVVTAALAVLEATSPGALDHCIAGHCSEESGHRLLLEKLGKQPLLDLGLRLGEGSGALLAVPLVRLAATGITQVATFEEWGLDRG